MDNNPEVDDVTSGLKTTAIADDESPDVKDTPDVANGTGEGDEGVRTNVGNVRESPVSPPNGQATEMCRKSNSSKSKNPLKFLRRLSSAKSTKNKNKASEQSAMEQLLQDVKVDSLPQVFITKYMGFKPCNELWGIHVTRPLVDQLVSEVSTLDAEGGEDLPLAQLKVSMEGIHVKEHSENKCRSKHVDKGLIPIEFVSYGVQDTRYTRVFAFILVREMSSKSRKLECHAYVCDSTTNCRKLSLSVAMAFQEYSKSLEGKDYKFQVDLNPTQQDSPRENPENGDDSAKEDAPAADDFEV